MVIKGSRHEDERGILTFNNAFDASEVKRIYTIQNHSTDFIRGWQGHTTEQRWFAAVQGSFEIRVILLNNAETPDPELPETCHTLTSATLDFLHVPAGCITALRALEEHSKLLVMSNYALGEIQDEIRFPLSYFNSGPQKI